MDLNKWDLSQTNFQNDLEKGQIGEKFFINDFSDFFEIDFSNVSKDVEYQKLKVDFASSLGLFEVKFNYNELDWITIEEYSNVNNLKPDGWWYKTRATYLVFVSKYENYPMIFLKMSDDVRKTYEKIKEKYPLEKNKISTSKGNNWQSAYRKIPLKIFKGHYAKFKKI